MTNAAYSFATRFEEAPGTNPEELIAAAHAAAPSEHPPYVRSAARSTPEAFPPLTRPAIFRPS